MWSMYVKTIKLAVNSTNPLAVAKKGEMAEQLRSWLEARDCALAADALIENGYDDMDVFTVRMFPSSWSLVHLLT